MFIVRFVHWDDSPVEEYYYHNLSDAEYHMSLFSDDDADLYSRIEILEYGKDEDKPLFSKNFNNPLANQQL